ncbi:hypothetical protein [Flavobacterium sp.]|uniref:hypothetical protein n=1 Tax=Flavobacterium sp. TaxID=239 RepID=UPI003D0EB7D5
MLKLVVIADPGLFAYASKIIISVSESFLGNHARICTTEQGVLRKVGSFLSGYAAVGSAWLLVFSEIFPGKEEVIVKCVHDLDESRIIGNVHWCSYGDMGEVVGKATVGCFCNNRVFQMNLVEYK